MTLGPPRWLVCLAARASYIGVQSVGIPVLADFNQVAASTVPFSTSRRPLPRWGRLQSAENLGFANYQGLQLGVTRRSRDGSSFLQTGYVLSRDLGAVSAAGRTAFLPPEMYQFPLTDRFNTRYDRGELTGTRRHRFLVTGLVPLPFGKGRLVGREWNRLTDAFLGGWELSTFTMVQSGSFQTPTMGAAFDRSNTNSLGRGVSARPDRIGNGNLPDPTMDRYYDKSAFVHPPAGAGRFGNAGGGILVGPGAIAVAAGLSKTFQLGGAARLRMEATFTNLPNHPNFYPPSVNIDDVNFGKLMFAQPAENAGNRTGQVGLRIDF
jgi:hypothetical protein